MPSLAEPRRPGRLRARLPLLLKASITAVLLAGLLAFVDLAALALALRRLDGWLAAAVAALLVAQAGLTALRWQLIARQLGLSLGPLQSLYWVLVGQFLNLALPTSIGGDGFRVWKLHRDNGAPLGSALLTVAIERGTGLILLALLVSLCSLSLRGQLTAQQLFPLAALGPAALLLVVPLLWAPRWAGSVPWPRLAGLLRRLGEANGHLLAHPAQTAAVLGLGVASSAIGLYAAWVLTAALGLHVGTAQVMALTGAAVIIAVLPISLGGWGVREASMVGLFSLVGVPTESAIAVSLLWGLLPVAISAPAALYWAFSNSRHAPGARMEIERR